MSGIVGSQIPDALKIIRFYRLPRIRGSRPQTSTTINLRSSPMSISSVTLNAIQKAGAAAFAADEKLKKEVQGYAERVNEAIVKNPYNLGNDALIESWKVLARLSQTMMGIEEELKNIHSIAAELTEDDQPSVREIPALAAPVSKKSKAKKIDAAVTTVKVKAKKAASAKPVTAVAAVAPAVDAAKIPAKRGVAKKAAVLPATAPAKAAPVKAVTKVTATPSKATPKAIAKVIVKAKSKKTKAAGTPVQAQELQGNSAKLMAHLQAVLNTADFSDINQSAVAKLAGIPIGSIGATIGRLVKAGRIVSGTNGSLKLTTTPAATPSADQAGSQQDAPVSAESAAQA